MTGSARRRWGWFAQIAGSALVLGLLVHDAEWGRVRGALAVVSLPWLLAAMGVKALGITAREVRLWLALSPWGRPPLGRVVAIGYTAGLVNNVVPARGGDLLGAGLLKLECRVPGTAALAAVGITSLLEALVFAVFLGVVALFHWSLWLTLLGAAAARETLGALTVLTLGTVAASVVLVVVGRRLQRREPPPEGGSGGPVALLRRTLVDVGRGLDTALPLLGNLALAALQVGCMVACYALLFPALGLEVTAPVLAASLILAVGSVVAIALPPTLAAGNVATAVGVLALFGVDEPAALAVGALIWVAHCGPIVALGGLPLWTRLGRLPRARELA